ERELEVRAHEEVRLELALVPDHTLTCGEADEHEQDRADLPAAEALRSPVARTRDGLLLLLEAREERRLAEADADEERDHHEDGRGHYADLLVRRDQTHEDSRQPHRRDRDQERVLAADDVAEGAEDDGSEWSDEEARGVSGESRELHRRRVVTGEEERRKER